MTKDRPWLNEVVELVNGAIDQAEGGAPALCCVDVEWLAGPETLRVFIDHAPAEGQDEPEEHITVDDCAVVNKILFECPELDQKINSPYNLEVSSLGLEPPLRLPRHFRCYLGETVKLKLSAPLDDGADTGSKNANKKSSIKGQLTAVTDTTISVTPLGSEPLTIPLDQILKARAAYSY